MTYILEDDDVPQLQPDAFRAHLRELEKQMILQ
jgi:hypothetical protein